MIKKSLLPGDIHLVTESLPDRYSVALGVWIKLGSADEAPTQNGISHFYEHMVFKGTKKYSAFDLAMQIEGRGGYLNAYTTREYTCFYARVATEEVDTALDIICGMINEPNLDLEEFRKERGVIIEEIRGYDDTPDDAVLDLFAKALWKDGQMERPIAGTAASVKKLKHEHLLAHQQRVLNEAGMAVIAVGDVKHAQLKRKVQSLLENRRGGEFIQREVADFRGAHLTRSRRNIQQNHIVMGTALPADPSLVYPMGFLNVMLGEGMASRLFQKVREEMGLAYTVYSNVDVHEACRVFSVYMATEAKSGQAAIDAVHAELKRFLKDGFSKEEFENTKRNILGGLHLSLDNHNNRLNRHARSLVRFGRLIPVKELVTKVDRTKPKQVMDVAELLFQDSKWASACISPESVKKLDARFHGG